VSEQKKILETLDAMLVDMREIVDRLQREKRGRGVEIAANWPTMIPRLSCGECGRPDHGDERGWTMRLDVDDELVTFCPECDVREFDDA
jgi:hypothetical protein